MGKIIGWSCAILAGLALPSEAIDAIDCAAGARMEARVVDVAAGGVLTLVGGAQVSLAGILPYSPAIGEADSARQVVAALVKGRDVTLQFAQKKVPKADRHQRLSAQVFIANEHGPLWLQGELIAQGLARGHALKDNRACAAALIAHERRARERRAGYWRSGGFAVNGAHDVVKLGGLLDTFQIVEGRVLSVGQVRREVFLNFGRVWKDDFTVIIPAAVAARLEKNGLTLNTLERTRVRVRGYLQRRGGPAILLDVEEHLEVLGQGR